MTGPGSTRLAIVGGGVMGLMTAYYAAGRAASVTVLESSAVGDPHTASYGLTRSIRSDYLDPEYARLAREARRLWLDLQRGSAEPLLVDCGCLNLVKASITPDRAASYAAGSYAVLERLGLPREHLSGAALRQRYPQFEADEGMLDVDAGFVDVQAATRLLRRELAARGVKIMEHADVRAVTPAAGPGPAGPGPAGPGPASGWTVRTSGGDLAADAVVVTAGLGTNDVLAAIPGCDLSFPLRPDRPAQSMYFIPPEHSRAQFTEQALPVFAYLDVGIYGHPLFDGHTPGVKIGFYNPPDARRVPSRIASVQDFVDECMPGLRGAEAVDVAEASGVDTCSYDLVGDDEFIIGPVPGADGIYTGVGWRGTGYKFAPWAGRVLAQLATGRGTVYDIRRFSPARFEGARS